MCWLGKEKEAWRVARGVLSEYAVIESFDRSIQRRRDTGQVDRNAEYGCYNEGTDHCVENEVPHGRDQCRNSDG